MNSPAIMAHRSYLRARCNLVIVHSRRAGGNTASIQRISIVRNLIFSFPKAARLSTANSNQIVRTLPKRFLLIISVGLFQFHLYLYESVQKTSE